MQAKSQLVVHCGANRVSWDRIQNSYCPPGDDLSSSRPFVPVPHGELVSMVKDELSGIGLNIVEEAYALRNVGEIKDAEMFSVMLVEATNDDFSLAVGIRNSHAKTLPAGLLFGSHVFVCDNLAFGGENVLARKHTRNVFEDLENLVKKAVAETTIFQTRQEEQYLRFQEVQLTHEEAVNALVDMSMGHDILPWARVKLAIEEWSNPSFQKHTRFGLSVWRLLQAVTEVVKPSALRKRNGGGRQAAATIWGNPSSTIMLHKVLDDLCDLKEGTGDKESNLILLP